MYDNRYIFKTAPFFMFKKFELFPSLNVLGGELRPCSKDPVTGFLEMAIATLAKKTEDPTRYVWRSPMIS